MFLVYLPKNKVQRRQGSEVILIKNAGSKSISTKQLSNNLKKEYKKFKLVPGDVLKTIPKFKITPV